MPYSTDLAQKQAQQDRIAASLGLTKTARDSADPIPVNPEEELRQIMEYPGAAVSGPGLPADLPPAPKRPAKRTPRPAAEPTATEVVPPGPATSPSSVADLPNAPPQVQIDQWKRQFGDVYLFKLDDTNVIIYRYLQYFEWANQLQKQEGLVDDQVALQEAILRRCVLWPKISPEWLNSAQAGLPELITNMIMRTSYFIEPSVAITFVEKL